MNKKQNSRKTSLRKQSKISVMELMKLLDNYRHSIIINYSKLRDRYQRQGIKRVRGVRDHSGNLTRPGLDTKNIDSSEYVGINGFSINSNTATINMLLSRRTQLHDLENQTLVSEAAGVLLNNLHIFNNYTIVSEGKINVSHLFVKISNKAVFEVLRKKGVLQQNNKSVDNFDFRSEYIISLEDLPLLPENIRYESIQGLFTELAFVKILISILSACLKQVSDKFTSEQISELKQHYLSVSTSGNTSGNIYINFPTTTEYFDMGTALATGNIQEKQSCKINIGSTDILNLSKLYSANKFFQRRYQLIDIETGEIYTKPTLDMIYRQNVTCGHKSVSPRMKITKVDELMQHLFDDFLGLENHHTTINLLQKVRASKLKRLLLLKNLQDHQSVDEEKLVKAMTEAKAKLKKYSEKIHQEKIYPLILHIGIKGTLPQEIPVTTMTADELVAKYPHLHLSKLEQQGSFFEIGESIISTYDKTEYHSTSA
ncbi:MAG: hypothetical protein AAF208_07015 [Cyanobacteria bacterium P01_A01_bin.45]